MEFYLSGIGWVTSAGQGFGKEGGTCILSDAPLPPLARKDVFAEPNQRFGRMSSYAKLGLAAVAFALRDAGLEAWEAKRPIGVVAATRLGCLATDLEYHRTVLLEGGGLASPNLFAYTLANCFLGDAAIQFGLTGSSIAINESREGLDALRIALENLEMGEAQTMLAGICDLATPEAFAGAASVLPGAAFLVLTADPAAATYNYGTVSLGDDGRILYNGSAAESLVELVQTALCGRQKTQQEVPPATPALGQAAAEAVKL
jgi:3-oxoacyl-[acyl-carrier-protein] synthase II